MTLPTEIWPAVGLLAVGLMFGLGVGLLWRRGDGGRFRRLRGELEQAQEELRSSRLELASQRNEVAKHFGQTSELFHDLTRQYTALYAHLAEGARELCPESHIPLGHGFGAPQLGGGDAVPEGEGPAAASAPEPEVPRPGEEQTRAPGSADHS